VIEEYAPGRFRVKKRRIGGARSNLSAPMLIVDEMPPLEHVDGRFYTSKALYGAVTRAHGLTEVGTEKFKPKQRASLNPENTRRRREALKVAMEKYKAGHRVRSG